MVDRVLRQPALARSSSWYGRVLSLAAYVWPTCNYGVDPGFHYLTIDVQFEVFREGWMTMLDGIRQLCSHRDCHE